MAGLHRVIDTRQICEYLDSTISKVLTVLKRRMITTLNRKLLEKQRVDRTALVPMRYTHRSLFFLQCQRYCQFLKLFNPVNSQISKFFTGLTDWLTDWQTDKTDCLTLRACARGVNTPEAPELGTPRYYGQLNFGSQWCPCLGCLFIKHDQWMLLYLFSLEHHHQQQQQGWKGPLEFFCTGLGSLASSLLVVIHEWQHGL